MILKHPSKYSLIVISLLLALLISGTASAAWWDSDWNSLSTVHLDASAPDNDFQIHLTSDDFTIPTKMWMNMNQDGNDTRILHIDNSTVFPIWIDHLTSPDNWSVWVNVTDNTTGDKLYWYYGNPNATSVSNGTQTFIKWRGFENTPFVGDSVQAQPFIYEAKARVTSGTHDIRWGMDSDTSPKDAVHFEAYSPNNRRYLIGYNEGSLIGGASQYETPTFTLNQWHMLKIVCSPTRYDGYVDGNPISTGRATTTLNRDMGLFHSHGTGTGEQEWAFIRKYGITPVITSMTLTVVTNTPPSKPDIIYPLDNGIVKSVCDAVELKYNSSDIDNDALKYYFYGDTINGSTFLGVNDSVNGNTFNWSITQYDVYYTRCQSYDGYNFSEMSNITSFTLLKPPTLNTPGNQSNIYETFPPLTSSVSFYWHDVAAPQYRLMIAEDINFNVMSVDNHVGVNNSEHFLLVNKEYFWKVYSYDGITYSDSSDIFGFNLTGNSTLTGSAIEGVVYKSNGDASAITGAEVSIWNSTWSSSMVTGSNGYYVFEDLESGTVYNLQAKSDRYWDSSIALVNATSDPVTNNFYLIDDLTDTEWWHYVEFTLQNVWGVTFPDVATKVYIGDSPTISDYGNTESDGTISFHMDQNVQYRITFINSTLGINEEVKLYPISKSYSIYIDSYSFGTPDVVTDDIQAYIVSSRISATHGYINFTWSDTSDLTTSINYYIFDVDGNELYNTSTNNSDLFDSQIVAAIDDRYIVQYVGVHPTHGTIDKTETVVFHGGRRVDFGWDSDWQYAVTALAFLIFIGVLFGAKTAQYGAIAVVMFAWIFKWIGWLDETNTSTLLIILAAVIAFGWSLRKSEEVKM